MIRFLQPARGRYMALQILDNQDGKEISSIAELYLRDAGGKRIGRES